MRQAICVLAALFGCTACPANVQQHAAFERAALVPPVTTAPVGALVRFEVRPPVARGTAWSLDCHGLARFATGDHDHLDWTAESTPIWLEAMVAPWNPAEHPERGGRGWLTFSYQGGPTQALSADLPVRALPYREIAPVTFSSFFSLEPRTEPLSAARKEGRVTVTFRTPVDAGVPIAPEVGAMLLETGGRHVLYAEVRTNFGESAAKDQVGYDVTLSYADTVPGPVDVTVVDWVGHGAYYGAFELHRITVPASTAAPAP